MRPATEKPWRPEPTVSLDELSKRCHASPQRAHLSLPPETHDVPPTVSPIACTKSFRAGPPLNPALAKGHLTLCNACCNANAKRMQSRQTPLVASDLKQTTLNSSGPGSMLMRHRTMPVTRRYHLADTNEADAQIARIRQRLAALEAERLELQRQLEALEQRTVADGHDVPRRIDFSDAPVTNASSSAEKLALFRDLFAGRPDVFPQRWQNSRTGRSGYSLACRNEWVAGVCGKPKVKCGECAHQSFIPPDDAIIERHLRGGDGRDGDFVAGVYPLLQDGTCRFLADDFDKAGWADDARAFLDVCHAEGISAGLERSRSGNGGHVWIFFREPVAARAARQLGAALITETMDGHPDVGFASYDLLFPSQDTMPLRGFGNRIALPLQRAAREAGNSVFVDADLRPHDDQWAFLSSLPRLSAQAVSKTVEEAERSGRVLGVRMPVEDEHADKPRKRSPSRAAPSRVVSTRMFRRT